MDRRVGLAASVWSVALGIGIVACAGMAAYGQEAEKPVAPPAPQAFDTPLVRDLKLIREVDALTKRVAELEKKVAGIEAALAAAAAKKP